MPKSSETRNKNKNQSKIWHSIKPIAPGGGTNSLRLYGNPKPKRLQYIVKVTPGK
jgi:hypothetical protein